MKLKLKLDKNAILDFFSKRREDRLRRGGLGLLIYCLLRSDQGGTVRPNAGAVADASHRAKSQIDSTPADSGKKAVEDYVTQVKQKSHSGEAL